MYLLVAAPSSSATLMLACQMKQEALATLIGQETGGNMRGTNGGWIASLRPPPSGIELDLPLEGYFPPDEQPDGGLLPDAARGVDTQLEAVRLMIANEPSR